MVEVEPRTQGSAESGPCRVEDTRNHMARDKPSQGQAEPGTQCYRGATSRKKRMVQPGGGPSSGR